MKNLKLVIFALIVLIIASGIYIKSRFPATITGSDLCSKREETEQIEKEKYDFSSFTLETGEVFSVYELGHADRPILRFEPDEFVGAAHSSYSVNSNAGSFRLNQNIKNKYRIEFWELSVKNTGFEITGRLSNRGDSLNFTFSMNVASEKELTFALRTKNADKEVTNIAVRFKSPPDERIFGFGEQYSYLNMQGRPVPIWVQEQGIARGKMPDSVLVNMVSRYSSGAWHSSYAPVPYFITDRPRALVLGNNQFSLFDFQDEKEAEIQVWTSEMSGRFFTGDNPKEVLESYSGFAGRMSPLPDWADKGAIVHIQGGSERVRNVAKRLTDTGVPLAALWIEDWAGTRDQPGPRLSWNWRVDRTLYPDWEKLISDLREEGIRVLIYFNPYLIETSDDSSQEKDLHTVAKERSYFIENDQGKAYSLDIEGPNDAGMLDMTNKPGREWIKGIMKRQLELGISGWMADYGEYLPSDAVLNSGADPMSHHNRYPVEWARLNYEALKEADKADEALFFTRSGFTKSPAESMLFWPGDQNIGWGKHDGLKSVVPALLSSGLSGFSLNHPDIGGYRSISVPLFTYHRSDELVKRWIELATFTAAFRWHSGSEPERNIQVYENDEISEYFARFARVFKALEPYREKLMEEAQDKGLPLVRHLMLHYPDDSEVYALDQEFMLGPDFLVRPVVSKGVREVSVYLPKGEWIHLWTYKKYGSRDKGVWLDIDAPLGRPPVFYRRDSEAGRNLKIKLKSLKRIHATLAL
ncbi:alpha-glucosidase [Candidatus Bipolaricaulota bacterium]|nr:alpha-glucosidase [Candidatus Bipolaricaulota bacterium]